LDSGPYTDPDVASAIGGGGNLEELAAQKSSSPLALLTEYLTPMARKIMGRHGSFFGVTPLLIFREITAPTKPGEQPQV